MINDELGDRMKALEKVEAGRRATPLLPICVRIDGRCFSSWTRGLARPFDESLSMTMIETAKFLVEETHAKIGYTQSDEISLVLHSDNPEAEAFFGGKFQKLTSVLASLATAKFNDEARQRLGDHVTRAGLATFDARAWNVPSTTEAANVILWRALDAVKNSVAMAARGHFSHKQLDHKSGKQMQAMLLEAGVDWMTFPAFFRHGTFVRRETYLTELDAATLARIPEARRPAPGTRFERSRVVVVPMPPFNYVTNREDVIFKGAAPVTIENQLGHVLAELDQRFPKTMQELTD